MYAEIVISYLIEIVKKCQTAVSYGQILDPADSPNLLSPAAEVPVGAAFPTVPLHLIEYIALMKSCRP